MIVTVGNTKGGVGKTTLAVQLALARTLAGRDVLLVDGDRQGSA
jgi:chromosome partitioning protein